MNDANALGVFLPLPRIPNRPQGPRAELLAAVVGDELAEPLRAAEALLREVRAAVDDVETHRPGPMGKAWRQALEDDAADLAAGTIPERWRAARLLDEDPQRWTYARLLAGAFPKRWRAAEARLDRAAIGRAAEVRAAEVATRFAQVAADAWSVHDNPHAAWPLVGEGERLLDEYRAAHEVLTWGAVRGASSSLVLDASSIPGGPTAAGHWLATKLALEPQRKLMGVPRNVDWPAGADQLIGRALPVGGGRLGDLMTKGVAEAKEVV